MKNPSIFLIVACVVLLGAACRDHSAPARASKPEDFTTQTELAAFRSTLGTPPATLDGPASRDSLLSEFAHALAKRDTARLTSLQISRAEFAYLYYPDSRLSKPPYELDPETMWQQIELQRVRGMQRLLMRYGGRSLRLRSTQCQPPERQNRVVIHECSVVTGATGEPKQLFGSILERDGRFKFVGFANHL